MISKREALAHLHDVVPEQCRGCFPHLTVKVMGALATQIVRSEISIDQGQEEIIAYTADCPGPTPDPTQEDSPRICPQSKKPA